MRRKRPLPGILKDPEKRKAMMVEAIIAIQALAGIEVSREQAETAYEKVQKEQDLLR